MDAHTDRFGFFDDSHYGDEDAERAAFPELRDSSHYCKHGNYIGTPFGADYMCHWCEMGEEPDLHTYEVTVRLQRDIVSHDEEVAMDKLWSILREAAANNDDQVFEFTARVVPVEDVS